MRRANIAGTLNLTALSRLHFSVLDREQQAQAIRRLATQGQSPNTIAAATGLAVEQIRHILGAAASCATTT